MIIIGSTVLYFEAEVSYHDFREPVIGENNTKIQFGEFNLPWYRSCDKRNKISSLSESKFLPFRPIKLGRFVKL